MKLMNQTKNTCAAEVVVKAESLLARMRGLLGRRSWPEHHTLWIQDCPSIHTFFMKFSIDAVFVDSHLVVKACHANLKPWRLVAPVWGAKSVFEFSVGSIEKAKIEVGDQLYVGN